ncbi:MAG: septal ring lytic transglycosylase RlpA family lipoprotein [SAR86 cluster bacterium]|uniref:Endolytic peptidoglycan transglycosylase RlpA n=1 Tax=SAR86 cluster bacterium TaxID=2030880 RepID=A0A2A4MIA9_9GAMM|nr:MAG: septal ring lytic transglycosylase RlpA family lipoprotein [SAR86 cluster bacterium]
MLAGLFLLLISCNSLPPNTTSSNSANAGRYSISQDRAPQRAVDLSLIREVIPVAVNRTMAGNKSPYTVLGKSYTVLATEEGYFERGIASWYGEKFHGHDTSNGEVFDMYQASAAHKSLPIPSFLRVTNLDNNRSIIVRVNDRGPFHPDRIIDLSYGAALKLDYANKGTARVQLEALMPAAVTSDVGVSTRATPLNSLERSVEGAAAKRYLQVGAFSDLRAAQRLLRQLNDLTTQPVFIQTLRAGSDEALHRVRIGPLNNSLQIRQISQRVVAQNLGNPYTVTE